MESTQKVAHRVKDVENIKKLRDTKNKMRKSNRDIRNSRRTERKGREAIYQDINTMVEN